MSIASIPGMLWTLGWTRVVDGILPVAMRSLGGGARRFDDMARFDGARRFDDEARFDDELMVEREDCRCLLSSYVVDLSIYEIEVERVCA